MCTRIYIIFQILYISEKLYSHSLHILMRLGSKLQILDMKRSAHVCIYVYIFIMGIYILDIRYRIVSHEKGQKDMCVINLILYSTRFDLFVNLYINKITDSEVRTYILIWLISSCQCSLNARLIETLYHKVEMAFQRFYN